MPQQISDVTRLRNRAIEMRALAEKIAHPKEKRMALDMAEKYEKLARRAEAKTTSLVAC